MLGSKDHVYLNFIKIDRNSHSGAEEQAHPFYRSGSESKKLQETGKPVNEK